MRSVPTTTGAAIAGALLATQLLGCGKPAAQTATVSGTVLVDGELVDRGTVTFYPLGEGAPATGRVRGDGTYSLQVGQGNASDVDASRVPTGDYLVTVVVNTESTETLGEGGPPIPGPRITPEAYASADTSDLRRTVKPGVNVFAFELERAKPPADDEAEDDAEAAAQADEAQAGETQSDAADAAVPAADADATEGDASDGNAAEGEAEAGDAEAAKSEAAAEAAESDEAEGTEPSEGGGKL